MRPSLVRGNYTLGEAINTAVWAGERSKQSDSISLRVIVIIININIIIFCYPQNPIQNN